jgi:hypothetical protein
MQGMALSAAVHSAMPAAQALLLARWGVPRER